MFKRKKKKIQPKPKAESPKQIQQILAVSSLPKKLLEENSHDGHVAVPLLTSKHFNGCIGTGTLSNFQFLNDCAFLRGCTEALHSKITVLLHWRANRSNYHPALPRPGGSSA